MVLDSSTYYYYYPAHNGQDHRQSLPYFYDDQLLAAGPNAGAGYGQIPAPAALGGYYDSNNYDCNQDSNNVGYMGPDSRPSILAGEEWKVSSSRRVSQSKPLPQEPPMPPPRSSLFMDNNNYFYERQHPYQAIQQQYQPPSAYHDESSLYQETEEKPASVKSTKSTESVKKSGRQITVQSINKEHRVWITVEPTETGLSLAEKIKTIATFRTRKILSITTAAGRAVPLDNRPVFGSWMDMDSFQDGEQWKVEWGELDKSMVDKIFSKVLQVSGGGRKK
ncbi:hypothetical protein VTP01DRAFT_9492 [Rhizomucor pusillus]|uniref:uncharacterized protein n=1 Tax=Rhizomucor pusillus TaxID=4840 RepID=UPI00374425F1